MHKTVLPISVLLDDIKELGLPIIVHHDFTLLLNAYPDSVQETDYALEFLSSGKYVASVSLSNASLIQIYRPDNIIIDCLKCYRIINPDHISGNCCYIYWPKERS